MWWVAYLVFRCTLTLCSILPCNLCKQRFTRFVFIMLPLNIGIGFYSYSIEIFKKTSKQHIYFSRRHSTISNLEEGVTCTSKYVIKHNCFYDEKYRHTIHRHHCFFFFLFFSKIFFIFCNFVIIFFLIMESSVIIVIGFDLER